MRSCGFSGFHLPPFDTSKTCEENFFFFVRASWPQRGIGCVHMGNLSVTASEAAAWLLFHYFYAGMSLSSLSAAAACHHSNPSSIHWNLHFISFINFFLALDGLVGNCEWTNLRSCTHMFLKYDCRQQPANWMLLKNKTNKKRKHKKKNKKINPATSVELQAADLFTGNHVGYWPLILSAVLNRSIDDVQSKGEGWNSVMKGGNTQMVT